MFHTKIMIFFYFKKIAKLCQSWDSFCMQKLQMTTFVCIIAIDNFLYTIAFVKYNRNKNIVTQTTEWHFCKTHLEQTDWNCTYRAVTAVIGYKRFTFLCFSYESKACINSLQTRTLKLSDVRDHSSSNC